MLAHLTKFLLVVIGLSRWLYTHSPYIPIHLKVKGYIPTYEVDGCLPSFSSATFTHQRPRHFDPVKLRRLGSSRCSFLTENSEIISPAPAWHSHDWPKCGVHGGEATSSRGVVTVVMVNVG